MKLSDYVARFLANKGIRHVFVFSGGASIHLIHSVADAPNIEFVCPLHEQAAAMAADGYSRVTGNMGAAIATSGPGATNLMTGVCSAYFDSVPVIYITGQVATFRMKGDTGVRQIGFQELNCVEMYKDVTNYAVTVLKSENIRYELEKACFLATHGRPGPVLIDIPDNIQREEIEQERLIPFIPDESQRRHGIGADDIGKCLTLIKEAKRPVVILGWGIHLSDAYEETQSFIEALGFPVAPTWAVAHTLPSHHSLFAGTFGTHGTRYGNFTVQNSDLVISIGSRLDTKATGSPADTFAREAKKIVVDIDDNELKKFSRLGMNVDLLVNCGVKDFFSALGPKIKGIKKPELSTWFEQIKIWKEKYPICPGDYYLEKDVNPYVFVKILSKGSDEGDVIFVDTGCTLAWMMQAFDFKKNQRLFHDFNNTAMGWALPASIGASLALNKKPVTCVVGDGALLINIQELATVIKHELPIKIFVLDNKGHGMVQQTQDQWLNSRYYATAIEGGLPKVDLSKIAKAFGFNAVMNVSKTCEIEQAVREVMKIAGPVFCNIEIDPRHRVIPQVKFGRPNEDTEPLLPREEFYANMSVKPIS